MARFGLSLSTKCNANCVFCEIPHQERYLKPVDIGFENILRTLKEKRETHDELRLTGGEPTIYPRVLEIIDYAKNVCKYKDIKIESHGIGFENEEHAKNLAKHGVDFFQISFQTVDAQAYEKITMVRDSLNRVIKGIENIKKSGFSFGFSTVVHKFNYEKLPEIVAFLAGYQPKYIILSSFNPIGSKFVDGRAVSAVSYSESKKYIRKSLQVAKDLGYQGLHPINFPFCILRDLLEEFPGFLGDIPEISLASNAAKKKLGVCGSCLYNQSCKGNWKAYIDHFGENEFSPILEPISSKNVQLMSPRPIVASGQGIVSSE